MEDRLKTQQTELEEGLVREGWRIVGRDAGPAWWAADGRRVGGHASGEPINKGHWAHSLTVILDQTRQMRDGNA